MINPANINLEIQLLSDDWGIYYIDQISQQKIYTRFYKGKSNNLQNPVLLVGNQGDPQYQNQQQPFQQPPN